VAQHSLWQRYKCSGKRRVSTENQNLNPLPTYVSFAHIINLILLTSVRSGSHTISCWRGMGKTELRCVPSLKQDCCPNIHSGNDFISTTPCPLPERLECRLFRLLGFPSCYANSIDAQLPLQYRIADDESPKSLHSCFAPAVIMSPAQRP